MAGAEPESNPFFVVSQQSFERICPPSRIVPVDEQSGDTVIDRSGQSAHGSGDNGSARRLRFEGDESKGFTARGNGDDVRRPEPLR